MKNTKSSEEKQSLRRYRLSYIIIFLSIAILIVPIWLTFCKNQFDKLSVETMFTAIIGLVGTWVGTIIAFYFSKDNFEAASQSTQSLVDKIASGDKLKSYIAKDYMISLAEFSPLVLENDEAEKNLKLSDILTNHLTKYNRLPVFNKAGAPKYIIHRSIIDRFIVEKTIENADINDLSLKSLVESSYVDQVKAFGIAKQTDSLMSIKTIMESLSEPDEKILYSDIFVTENGSRSGKVIGWITNAIINEQAQV